MSFIGIITNKSNKIDLENIIKENNCLEDRVITLKTENAENIRNIKFDILIINYPIKYDSFIKDVIKNSKSILINSDIQFDYRFFEKLNAYVITYGFNKKATITIISSEEDYVILDVQRDIKGIKSALIESGEVKFSLKHSRNFLYEEVVSGIIKILYG